MSAINLRAVHVAHAVFLAEVRREIGSALSDIGNDARQYALSKSDEFKLNRPSKTRQATKFRVTLGKRVAKVRVFNRSLVARVLQSGSRPHMIVARGRALRFQADGQTVFRKRVRHPGTKPTRWWTNLEKHSQDFAIRRFQRAIARTQALFRRLRA